MTANLILDYHLDVPEWAAVAYLMLLAMFLVWAVAARRK